MLLCFRGGINSAYHTNQSCFYKGDWYYAVSAGNTGDGEDRREAEHYATVARVPIDSGREAKTVIQDKVTGYDHYAMSMMPRDDGLYLVMDNSYCCYFYSPECFEIISDEYGILSRRSVYYSFHGGGDEIKKY